MDDDPITAKVQWRFGDRAEAAVAWLTSPEQLHVYVDFQSPQTPSGQWHRIMTVTVSWVRKHIDEAEQGAMWPALLIVPDGTRRAIEDYVTRILRDTWPLLVREATLLPLDYQPEAW